MFSLVIRSLAGELIYFSPHIFMFRQYQNRSFITILDIPLPQPPDWNGTRILLYKVTFRTVHFPKCSKNIYLNTRNNFLQKSFQIKIFSEERTNPARCDVMYLKYLIVWLQIHPILQFHFLTFTMAPFFHYPKFIILETHFWPKDFCSLTRNWHDSGERWFQSYFEVYIDSDQTNLS